MVPVMGRAGVWLEERVGNSLGQALQGDIDIGVTVQFGCWRTPIRRSSGKYTLQGKRRRKGTAQAGARQEPVTQPS
jgi:hypothetical protein